jgi:hypothetical protein
VHVYLVLGPESPLNVRHGTTLGSKVVIPIKKALAILKGVVEVGKDVVELARGGQLGVLIVIDNADVMCERSKLFPEGLDVPLKLKILLVCSRDQQEVKKR